MLFVTFYIILLFNSKSTRTYLETIPIIQSVQFCLFQLQSPIIFLEIDLFDDIDEFINILKQSEDIIDAYMIVYIIFNLLSQMMSGTS